MTLYFPDISYLPETLIVPYIHIHQIIGTWDLVSDVKLCECNVALLS